MSGAELQTLIDGTRSLADTRFPSLHNGSLVCLEAGNLHRYVANINSAAKQSLDIGMLETRYSGLNAGIKGFSNLLEFIPNLSHAINLCRAGNSPPLGPFYSLDNLFYQASVLIILGQWNMVDELIEVSHQPETEEIVLKRAKYWDCYQVMFRACLEQDIETFNQFGARLATLKRHTQEKFFDIYLDQYRAILSNDEASLLQAISVANESYPSRKKKMELDIEEGGQQYNDICLDYRSVVSLRIARHREMSVTFDSVFIPQDLVEYEPV